MGNIIDNHYINISGLCFDTQFLEIFLKLKLFFLLYFNNINIEISEFDVIFNTLKEKLVLNEKKLDPFNLNSLDILDKESIKYLNLNSEKEILIKWRTYASFLIYIRNKVKECINYINSIEINLTHQIFKKLKIKLSNILKNLYPIELYSNIIQVEKEIIIKNIFGKGSEIILVLKNKENNDIIFNKLLYIIEQLVYINKELLLAVDFYNLTGIDIKNLNSIIIYSLNSILKILNEKKGIDINFNVLIYIPEWTMENITNILHFISTSNEKNN